jgi:ribonuclease P protein component
VVPKRHARRAVTRNLLKRQMRAVMEAHGGELPPGLWVLRLKQPFDRKTFVSASSEALRTAARDELKLLLQRALRPAAAAASPRPPRPPQAGTP